MGQYQSLGAAQEALRPNFPAKPLAPGKNCLHASPTHRLTGEDKISTSGLQVLPTQFFWGGEQEQALVCVCVCVCVCT
jgi:hypothetical protein